MANCLGGQYGGGILHKMRTPRLRLYIRRSRQMRRREISRPANSYNLVVVDRSAGRSALGSPYRFRQAFDHQQWAPIRWLTSIVVCYADRCDPRPPQYRTFVLTHVYTHPDSKCCVQATSSALPVQHLTLSAALSVCRNVVGISAFFFRLRR